MYTVTLQANDINGVSTIMNCLANTQLPMLEINVRGGAEPPRPALAAPRAAAPPVSRVVRPFLARQIYTDNEIECPICYDKIRDFSQFCLLRCGHAFHKACYERTEGQPCSVCRD